MVILPLRLLRSAPLSPLSPTTQRPGLPSVSSMGYPPATLPVPEEALPTTGVVAYAIGAFGLVTDPEAEAVGPPIARAEAVAPGLVGAVPRPLADASRFWGVLVMMLMTPPMALPP